MKFEIHSDPNLCLIEEVSINYLYLYVDSRKQIKEKNQRLTNLDSKIYYKLRHNCFKTLFLDLLGFPSTEERPFFEFGIDSNKTPDFLQKFESFFLLVEFTVVKNSFAAIKNKKSKTKYDYEISLMNQAGHICKDFYPSLVLSDSPANVINDLIDIAALLDIEFFENPEVVISKFHEDLNSLEFNISEFIPELLLNEEVSTKIKFKEPKKFSNIETLFHRSVQLSGVKRQRSQNIFNRIKKNSFNLEKQLKFIRYKAKFVIVVNSKNNSVFIDTDKDGVSKNTLLTMLQNLSIDLLNFVMIRGTFDDSDNPFEIYGKSLLLEDDQRDQLEESNFETGVYEDNFFRKLMRDSYSKDLSPFKLLGDSSLENQIDDVEINYIDLLKEKRLLSSNIQVYNKNVFLFPIGSGFNLGKYKKINIKTGKPITDYILKKIVRFNDFEKTVERDLKYDAMNDILNKQNKLFSRLINLVGDHKLVRKLRSIYKIEKQIELLGNNGISVSEDLTTILKENIELKIKLNEYIGEPTRQRYQNRISVPRSIYKKDWDIEMEHFGQKKGVIKICEEFDMQDLKNKFNDILTFLFQELDVKVSDDIHSDTIPLGKDFSKICSEMLESISDVKDRLLRTNLMHNLLFISRVCYSILFYSNIKLNKEDFMYDNLGYENCLLLVKGGKKILSTKKTRLFSLIFPINEKLTWIYQSKFTKIVRDEDNNLFCVLPWQTYFFPMAKKGVELYFNFSNYFICSQMESDLSYDYFKKFISCKVLNLFSQRRKVEVWFGSFRYLYLNSLATHTSVLELVESMVDYDYDPYFYYLQRCFASNYKNIYLHAKELKIYDMITNIAFENFDLCAEKFDETIFMTMAPFDRTNEHLKNLKSVLETHDYYLKNYSTEPLEQLQQSSVDCSEENYIEKLFEDDFKFDPKLNFCIGKYAGVYLNRLVSKETLSHEFTKIMQSSYTDISTSKGMRDSFGQFWGKKGHDVLFSNETTKNEVENFVTNLPKSNNDFNKILDNSEKTFQNVIENLSKITLEFDVKDKNQWKGSREIYVMSQNTKILQQPLERFFKFLCNWTPNELIHKKSHVRPKFIHSQVFEFESGEEEKTYTTLDCRKWAPRSNLWKYYYFILGMSDYLPPEFLDYFTQVWSLMFYKKIRIQKRYVDIMAKNKETSYLVGHLKKREDEDYELEMPYSFMMGIYNYLSSLLHAFSQLYFDEKISSRQNAKFSLIAHSDDSGGVIMSKSYENNLRIFKQYEIFQKCCNHLLSKKKSSLSKNFFEIISIMYANKRLIPMTHKFIGNVSFEPKGKGWVDDISTIVSKIVEIFSNGGSILQCYLTMLSMSEMIRKFYHLPRFKNLSQIPLAFGGIFNMHPIHLILLGADAQEIMLDLIETKGERNFRIKSYLALCGDYFPGKGSQVNYQIPYYKQHTFSLDLSSDDQEKAKMIASCIPYRTLGKKLMHYSQLKNNSYVYSLTGVDMTQIFVMTLFTNTFIIKEETKRCSLKKFTKNYAVLKALNVNAELEHYPKSNYHNYMKAAEGIRIKFSDINIKSMKTCKPINYSTFQNIGLGLNFTTINEIIAYNSKHDLKFLFADTTKMEILTQWVKNCIPSSDKYDVLELLMKLSSKDLEKVRSSYCFLPSGVSVDTIERFWTYINFYCTRRYYISTKRPQYFTIDQFKLWNLDYDSLKHYYLVLKIALLSDLNTTKIGKLKRNCECKGCSHNEAMKNMLDEILKLKKLQDNENMHTNLPFATYQTKQYKSINVWYGQSEFTLHTIYGNISLTRNDDGLCIVLDLVSAEFVDQIYFLFKNFVVSRGIMELTPTYDINDTAQSKIAFSDLNQPIIVGPGYKGMLIKNSMVNEINYQKKKITKFGNKYTYMGDNVDFEIYQNYDINPSFYKEHNLELIKDLIFENNVEIETGMLKRNITSSKLYKTLMLDEGQFSHLPFMDKYDNEGLLGSSRSLSKALMLADSKGLTSYRSSVNPTSLGTPILETQSYKDIPVLDLVTKCSFARVNYRERVVIEKMLNNNSISNQDQIILDKLVNKLGLKSTFSAITLIKTIFSSLSYNDVPSLSKETINDFLYTLIKSAITAIEERAITKQHQDQLFETKNQIFNKLYYLFDLDVKNDERAEYLSRLFFRAHLDNPSVFWENRKDNIYCALYKPSARHIPTQTKFLYACLNHLKNTIGYDKFLNIRQIIIAKNSQKQKMGELVKKTTKFRRTKPEFISGRFDFTDMKIKNYILNPDDEDNFEENIDMVNSGEDPEVYEERVWDEDLDEKSYLIFNQRDFNIMAEETLQENFSSVIIKTLFKHYEIPWLGYGQYYTEEKNNIVWYVSEFPGNSVPMMPLMDRVAEEQKTQKKKLTELVVEEEEENKIKHEKVDKNVLIKFENDEDAFNYQADVLKDIGVNNPEIYSKYFFKNKDFSNKDYFWAQFTKSLNDKFSKKKSLFNYGRKLRANIMPGFTGNLKDDNIRGELKALFGDHVDILTAGNQSMTPNLYRNSLMSIKRLFNSVQGNDRALLIIILALMKDCIISDRNDSWFSEPILGIINDLDEAILREDGSVYLPPLPADTVLTYEVRGEYDDYFD